MRGPKEDEAADDGATIQFDRYGIKVAVSPSAAGEEQDPRSWRDVANAINADLRSISVGIFRFLKETIKSATRIVRGVGELPGALANRIRGAHSQVDGIEASRQIEAASGTPGLVVLGDKEAALQRVKAILDKKRVGGLTVRTYSDGQQTVIWISRPIDDEEVEEVVQASLSAAPERALPTSTTKETK